MLHDLHALNEHALGARKSFGVPTSRFIADEEEDVGVLKRFGEIKLGEHGAQESHIALKHGDETGATEAFAQQTNVKP